MTATATATKLYRYDTVRIGKGKVDYLVVLPVDPCVAGATLIESKNTGRTKVVATERLTLVERGELGKIADSVEPCAICGSKDATGDSAVHWSTPFSSKSVARSCSDACADRIEAKRSADGVLTTAGVDRARKRWTKDQAARAATDMDGTTLVSGDTVQWRTSPIIWTVYPELERDRALVRIRTAEGRDMTVRADNVRKVVSRAEFSRTATGNGWTIVQDDDERLIAQRGEIRVVADYYATAPGLRGLGIFDLAGQAIWDAARETTIPRHLILAAMNAKLTETLTAA